MAPRQPQRIALAITHFDSRADAARSWAWHANGVMLIQKRLETDQIQWLDEFLLRSSFWNYGSRFQGMVSLFARR